MAIKVNLQLTITKSGGGNLLNPIASGPKDSRTEAEAAIKAALDAAAATAQQNAQDFADAQSAFTT